MNYHNYFGGILCNPVKWMNNYYLCNNFIYKVLFTSIVVFITKILSVYSLASTYLCFNNQTEPISKINIKLSNVVILFCLNTHRLRCNVFLVSDCN